MTYIKQAATDEVQRTKWHIEARRMAAELKGVVDWGDREDVKPAIVFDDMVVKVTIPVQAITTYTEEALAELLFSAVLKAAVPAAEEPAPAQAQPEAAPAAPEKCWRRIPPEFKEPCTRDAAGGIYLTLYPHERIQKRYGRKPVLRTVIDLPVCAECFGQMTPQEVIENALQPGQWGELSRAAQRMANGILPIKENSTIEMCPFEAPEYVNLRKFIAAQAGTPPAEGATEA